MDQKGNQDEHGDSRNEPTPLGLDVGTSRIVLSRGAGSGTKTDTQLNAFVSVPYSKFTENILKQNKVGYHLNGGKEIFIFGTESPNVLVDISATLDRKVAALRHHTSQIGDPAALADRIQTRSAETGALGGVPYAEGFRRVIMRA